MVQYWKTGDLARAKLVTMPDNSYAMLIEGERYPLYGFPRGPVLFGPLARLKHIAKNLVFNQVWKFLEEGTTNEEVMAYLKNVALPEILKEVEKSKYHFFPPEKMCPAVRELWRAFTAVQKRFGLGEEFATLKLGITFFFQEDDAYRFRLQWLAKYANPRAWARKLYRVFTGKPYSLKKEIETLFSLLGDAEITPDMKGRSTLIKRVLLALLEDKDFGKLIEATMWELDWKKLRLNKADSYYMRGKYFKVEHDKYDY